MPPLFLAIGRHISERCALTQVCYVPHLGDCSYLLQSYAVATVHLQHMQAHTVCTVKY